MANNKGMSGLDFTAAVFELKSCLPLWIGKIYQYNIDTFGFRFNGDEHLKYNFIAECPRRAHLCENLMDAPKNPSGYSMFLRKYITGGRVLDIAQYGIQRVIDFTIGKTEQQYHLIFEFFDDGNVILTDDNYIIINPLKNHTFKGRKVLPKEKYEFTGPARESITPDYIEGLLKASDKDLVKTAALDLMTGGEYAEEILAGTDLDKSTPCASLNDESRRAAAEKIHAAYLSVLACCEEKRKPVITKSGALPFLLKSAGNDAQDSITAYDSFSKALEAYYPIVKTTETKSSKQKLTKSEIILKRQKNALAGFEAKIADAQSKADLIYSEYQEISQICSVLKAASEKYSWQEIAGILKSADIPAAKAVAKIYPEDASADLVIDGKKIRLFIRESVEQNADRYYSEIKKYRKKKAGAEAAMEKFAKMKETEMPVRREKKTYTAAKPKWYHKFRWFYTSDGVLVVGGRDANSNEEIVKKYLQGPDTFMHADVHGGSAVIIKGETACMNEAAEFAASYSNLWKDGRFSGDVYAAGRSQVSKTAESGEFVAKGAFVIRGERKYFRNVTLQTAVGLQYEPSVCVIGGPVSAVEKRAKFFVKLAPGTYEPNDAAKKVLRALKEKISPEEEKNLKNILNTETIAAFMPPGGSDIIE